MTKQTKTIAQLNNFIILDKIPYVDKTAQDYESEAQLENSFIIDLQNQGYEYCKDINSLEAMKKNLKTQIEQLNNTKFTSDEWLRFNAQYLDCPNDNVIDKVCKIQQDYIYDFLFDDGRMSNIKIIDKEDFAKNKLQVINQFEQTGKYLNRYDVTILVNGLPLVHIELKKRGVAIKEAFNQVHRYSKESFNSANSLYKYLQIFVISNGADTRYFANTTKRNINSFDFTINWARVDNKTIEDLKDFTATFFLRQTLLAVICKFSVLDSSDNLLIMRPYQIAAVERILWKINSSYQAKNWSKIEGGGFIWHTTGSGKTLTSFKTAQLATKIDFIDKVLFVVDRKDLDNQTVKEYKKFSDTSSIGSDNVEGLRRNLISSENKIIVTTIQKLNILIKKDNNLSVYDKQVVFIFDECHRSQFGEAQRNIRKNFKKYYQFGFTGTPIKSQNARGEKTTQSTFGEELHSYIITNALRDDKVLKFKVDYNNVTPKFKEFEQIQDENKLTALENKKAFLHPQRIKTVSQYILENFRKKTGRHQAGAKGFNAMFAVSSVDAAKLYYEQLNKLQENEADKLKIATIFSFAANEEQKIAGNIEDESFELTAMNSSDKEFLCKVIEDYNQMFKANYGIESKLFQEYYKGLSKKVKHQEIDLIIVVGMFLTGFDAPTLNTLFVDKNLQYHGLIQAFSRTNRIFDSTKKFGNIVCFRDLEKNTAEAIRIFGKSESSEMVLEKSYKEYMEGFLDKETDKIRKGFIEIVKELKENFPDNSAIDTEADKKAFTKLFGQYLNSEHILQNYDEFTALKELQKIDKTDKQATSQLQAKYQISDEDFAAMQEIELPSPREIQNYKSTYNDIRQWRKEQAQAEENQNSDVDWNDVVFEVELIKSQEVNLDYILGIIHEKSKNQTKEELIIEAKEIIRASVGNRAKEGLIIDFINQANLVEIEDKDIFIDEFYQFARSKQQAEMEKIIQEEGLNEEQAQRYIKASLKKQFASENGLGLHEALPKMSPLNPQYKTKKHNVFEKIVKFIEKFKGISKN
ncbi:type I restriction endonuclease subunit R, partial [Rickettsiales bacterium]|nr:type I restriction endonuclease subunit R [Rickettsiales bacterium]